VTILLNVLVIALGGLIVAMVGALVSRLWCRWQGRESCTLHPLHDRVIEGFCLLGVLVATLLVTQHLVPAIGTTTPGKSVTARPAPVGAPSDSTAPTPTDDEPGGGLLPWL
jgi:hypothetical protein